MVLSSSEDVLAGISIENDCEQIVTVGHTSQRTLCSCTCLSSCLGTGNVAANYL